jgi:hypothetical protein
MTEMYSLRIYMEALRKKTRNLFQDIQVPTEIQTKHLLNTSLECYCQTNELLLFGMQWVQNQVFVNKMSCPRGKIAVSGHDSNV